MTNVAPIGVGDEVVRVKGEKYDIGSKGRVTATLDDRLQVYWHTSHSKPKKTWVKRGVVILATLEEITHPAVAGHTPGPWEKQSSGSAKEWEVTADNGDKWYAVAVATANHLGSGTVSLESAECNANLIAAAPDLLAALEQIVHDWHSVHPSAQVPDQINDDKHWDAARAAIAKAKGA